MKEYIVTKRFKEKAICGDVNLPYGTECNLIDNYICCDKGIICLTTSQNAYDYFSRNDDGNGLKRGELVHNIKNELSKIDDKHQVRWDRLWGNDAELTKFRRADSPEHWIWNHAFYNATIVDLERIYNLIKEVK